VDPEQQHLSWLIAGGAREPGGGVRSWANPSRPGFLYLEAGGLLLSLHAEALGRGDVVDPERVRADGVAVARWLLSRLDRGVVVHREARYAFDTAIVVAALDRWRTVSGDPAVGLEAAIDSGRGFLMNCLRTRQGQTGTADDGHWSRAFGPHLLKLAVALDDTDLLDDARTQLVRTCWDGRRFLLHARSDSWYPHAHAYALEGLLAMRARGQTIDLSMVDTGLATLRNAVQDADTPTDVAAQLIRLGLLRGWSAEDEGLSVAWARLRERARTGGGLVYRAGSSDVNTWTTIFTVQALRWSRIGADPAWLA
jgi:hypothetical protein